MDAEANWFPAEVARVYELVLASMPDLWQHYWQTRIAPLRNLTLTHGDAYFANFLCPNQGTMGNVYLIDWQSPETLWAASDLANLMATFWASEPRQENGREERLLRHYYAALQAGGVSGYRWEDLLLDYHLAVIDWLLVPLQDRYDGSSRDYWWWKMQCLLGAFRDWHCQALLKECVDF